MPKTEPTAPAEMRRNSSHSCHSFGEFATDCAECRAEQRDDARQAGPRVCPGWGAEKQCVHLPMRGSTYCHGCKCLRAAEISGMVGSVAGITRLEEPTTLREWVEHLFAAGWGFSLDDADLAFPDAILEDPIWDHDQGTFRATYHDGSVDVFYDLTGYGEPQDADYIKWKK